MRKFFTGKYIFHLLFWIMYAVFTILETQGYIVKKGLLFELAPLAIFFSLMATLMTINNNFLIPNLLEKRKYFLYLAGLAICVVGYTWLRSLNQRYWDAKVWPEEPMKLQDYFLWNFLYAVWFLIISSLLYFTQRWTDHRQRAKNIQISDLQAELKYLRSQLNPHFLFNGLNTIYGNIDSGNQQARNILLQFSDLLRYHLYEADVEMIEIDKEAVYLENYVALQRARSNANLRIELKISIEDKGVKITPLIFIAFVENAFKFSTRDDNQHNFVLISLEQKDQEVVFTCTNSFDQVESSGGIGLTNVKRRLALLYPGKHELVMKTEEGIYSVYLKLIL